MNPKMAPRNEQDRPIFKIINSYKKSYNKRVAKKGLPRMENPFCSISCCSRCGTILMKGRYPSGGSLRYAASATGAGL